MPELPEVETVARQLEQQIKGQRIRWVELRDPKLARVAIPSGARIIRAYRYGKQVALELDSEQSILIHLRMSGRLLVGPRGGAAPIEGAQALGSYLHDVEVSEKHLRARFGLERSSLLFVDARRFGTIELFKSDRLPSIGRDPLDEALKPADLFAMLKGSRQPIKQWLLRQDRLVGVGNIYASEALYRAGVHPELDAGAVNVENAERLFHALQEILRLAIVHGGTTFSDFLQSDGSMGEFGELLQVYEREGEPCMRCGDAINRIVQGGRSTYFCRTCQKRRGRGPRGNPKGRSAKARK